jgi:hypothetical protein
VTAIPAYNRGLGADAGQAVRQPVFLLAPGCSYSTVTLAMLAGHPDIFGFPEMPIFDALDIASLFNEPRRRPWAQAGWAAAYLSGVIRTTAELVYGSQSPADIQRAHAWLGDRRHWTTVQLMNYFLTLVSPHTAVAKSPEIAESGQALEACAAAYPRARFLHLTRHPVSTQRSMHAHWRGKPSLTGRALIIRAASAWYLGHSRIVTMLAELPDDRWLRVRAEDVLRQPRTWLPHILHWLGLPATDEVLAGMLHTERWRFAATPASARRFGRATDSFYHSPALRHIPDPGPVAFDQAWGMDEEMLMRMEMLAGYLGY